MKRAASERARTISVWRRHLVSHGVDAALCSCEYQAGRFRKSQRVGGCGTARCYLCHSEKLLKIPDRSQRRAEASFQEWRREVENNVIAGAYQALAADRDTATQARRR